MAKQSVNIGTTANDNTGDPLRTAFNKLNSNHDEIYAAGPVGTNLQVASNTIASTNSNGNVKIDPAGTGSIELAGPIDAQGVLTISSTVSGNIIPTANVTTNLGSDTVRFKEVHGNVLHVGSLILREVSNTLEIFRTDDSTNAILNGNSTTSGSVLANGTSQVKVNASGTIQLFSATSDASNATTISTASMTTPAITVAGNVVGGNLNTGAQVVATGNITGGNVITAGVATATGNITGGNIITAGLASVGTSVTAGTTITATGNITGGNLTTAGAITDGALISSDGTVTGAVAITASGAVTGGSFTDGTATISSGAISGATTIAASSTITATGNITGGNLTSAGISTTASTTYSGDSTSQTTAWKPSAVILTADASAISSSMTNFFPNAISLASGKYYEIKMHLVFENSSTGAVSMQLTDSGTALETIHLQGAYMNDGGTYTGTATISNTSSFLCASNSAAIHSGQINGAVTVSGATNLNIQASVASGTITPKKGSFIRVIEYSAGTVGSTA